MKLYFAFVDEFGNTHTSVCVGTPIELLKQLLVSGTTGMFDLNNPALSNQIMEVNQFWVDQQIVDKNLNEVLDHFDAMLVAGDNDDDAADLILEILSESLTEEPHEFVATLRKLFNGEIDDLSEMTDEQTLLMVMISL